MRSFALPRSIRVLLKVRYELQFSCSSCAESQVVSGIAVCVLVRGGGKVGQLFTCYSTGMPSLHTDTVVYIALHQAVSLQHFLPSYFIPSQLSTMVYLYLRALDIVAHLHLV